MKVSSLLTLIALTALLSSCSPTEPTVTAEEYCKSKGGQIQSEERDGKEMKTCFVNDGKDGIRCQLDLFHKKECGHAE